jgi:putative protease
MKTAPHSTKTVSAPSTERLQLGCLAASPAAVQAAIDNGADWVRIPCRQIGVAFVKELQEFIIGRLAKAIRYAHRERRKVVLDLNLPVTPAMWPHLRKTIAHACDEGVEALMLSDPALALCSAIHHPGLPLHFIAPPTVAANTARQLQHQLGVSRLLLPPTLSAARIGELAAINGLELDVLGFGAGLPQTERHEDDAALHGNLDVASNDASFSSGKLAAGALLQLPRLAELGIRTIQIEPRIEAPGEVAQVTKVWRTAIDKCLDDAEHYVVNPSWVRQLDALRVAR